MKKLRCRVAIQLTKDLRRWQSPHLIRGKLRRERSQGRDQGPEKRRAWNSREEAGRGWLYAGGRMRDGGVVRDTAGYEPAETRTGGRQGDRAG